MRNSLSGLHFSDNTVRFFDIKKGVRAAVGLLPSTIRDGEVKNKDELVKALTALHAQIANKGEVINVIASLAPNKILLEAFSLLDDIPENKLAESAKKHLDIIAPFNKSDRYDDAERLHNHDFLAGFAEKKLIEPYVDAMKQANFMPVAIEHPALSLNRIVPVNQSSIAIDVGNDGLLFVFSRFGKLYFSNFLSWTEIALGYDKNNNGLDFDEIIDAINDEINRIGTLAVVRKNPPQKIYINAPDEAVPIFIEKIYNGQIVVERLAPKALLGYPFDWYLAGGASLRGQIPRENDHQISLAPKDTEELYALQQRRSFFTVWRNIFAVSFGLLLLAFLLIDNLMLKIDINLQNQLASELAKPNMEEVFLLRAKAQNFNKLTAMAKTAQSRIVDWHKFFDSIAEYASGKVSLDGIRVRMEDKFGIIGGRSQNEVKVIDFKNALLADKRFVDVVLPLSDISPDGRGGVMFKMTFKVAHF